MFCLKTSHENSPPVNVTQELLKYYKMYFYFMVLFIDLQKHYNTVFFHCNEVKNDVYKFKHPAASM